jgi:hypothetical protein
VLKSFKYQWLFDELGLNNCPKADCVEINIVAFRWSHEPLDNNLNFLPNYLYHKERGRRPPRVLEPADLCNHCNLSFFDSEDAAKSLLSKYRSNLEQKHEDLLKHYTHIAVGEIKFEDGVSTKVRKNHFMFFEYDGVDFKTRDFELISLE